MIYLVSTQTQLFENDLYSALSVEKAIEMLSSWNRIQFDIETSGRDPHLTKILCAQFGNKKENVQIVVDLTTISILPFKEIIETKYIVGQNLKFDIQFLYNYGIIPSKVYDTMIVEQLLYLGYPSAIKQGGISVALDAIVQRRLGIVLDKSTRGEIIWRGLDSKVILYAASDVMYLEDIAEQQLEECGKNDCLIGAKLECDFVRVNAYMEWCGVKLDSNKWRKKMLQDQQYLDQAKKALDNFVINHPKLQEFVYINRQGDLFSGWDTEPKCNVLWSSSSQVSKVAKVLGFNTVIQDKKTGEDKETVIEKHLKKQKGINDEFLALYLGKGNEGDDDYFPGHQGAAKVVSSFGQGHLNAINPVTNRIHTQYHHLGADTGRMSSGSKQNNNDLAKIKKLPINPSPKQKKEGLGCPYPNMQQLPSDSSTRESFISKEGNLWVSCDYSAMESRLGADIYQEQAMIDEFLHGSGDIHSLVAKFCFEEVRNCTTEEIKTKYPHLRKKAKPIGFSQQFGGSAYAIQNSLGCSIEEAERIAFAYNDGFKGIADFKKKGADFVRKNGYIVLNPITGHRTYWYNHKEWIETQKSFTKDFWDDYRAYHKGTGDNIAMKVKKHFQTVSKWERKALNSVTQGTGSIILKFSQINTFNWVIENGYFNKILLCNLTHDEANWEFPEEATEFPNVLKNFMEESANKFCKSLPIPAEATVGNCWIH